MPPHAENKDQSKGQTEKNDKIGGKEKKDEIARFFQVIGHAQHMYTKKGEGKGNQAEKAVKNPDTGKGGEVHDVLFWGLGVIFYILDEVPAMSAFCIHRFIKILKEAYPKWNAPVITLMAATGATPFGVLVATLLSLRTKDEVTEVAARRLLARADTPEAMLLLGEDAIRELIFPVGFYPTKARRLVEICILLLEKYQGRVPDSLDALLELPGVGRKTANLVLVEGYGIPAICVDTHVHRISNRLGYVRTQTPEQTEMVLRATLPLEYWASYNEMLVAFGQVLCRPLSPWCSRCPVAVMCPRIGVGRSR